jgi:hypothetical protein
MEQTKGIIACCLYALRNDYGKEENETIIRK